MNIKDIWTDRQGKQFEIVNIDNNTDDAWIEYVNVDTQQEYSCRLEAFKYRFFPVVK
jgi:hypothetical protein